MGQAENNRGRRRRQDVLDALSELLRGRRLADIEVQDVARLAGISRSNFYFYFPTKAAAVAALMADVQVELQSVGVAWYVRDDLPDDVRVRRGMRATVRYWRSHAWLIAAMLDASREDVDVRVVWAGVIDGLAQGAGERMARDGHFSGVQAMGIARVLVDMTAAAMERDVKQIVEAGRPTRGLENALVHVWLSSTAAP